MSKQQDTRKENLLHLIDIYHRGKYGDYDETYAEFYATYIEGETPIPRYASLASDETYGMINLYDDLSEACENQADIPHMGDTLNVAVGIEDLDLGARVETMTVVLTLDTFHAMSGIVAMSEGKDVLEGGEATNKDGIFCDWEEIRRAFPITNFVPWVERNDVELTGQGYDPEAGF